MIHDLFALICRTFSIEKAAILLPTEQSDVYVPWGYIGIDSTTQRRLRIESQRLGGFADIDEGKEQSLTGQSLAPLRPYFSGREFALLEGLQVFPFVAESEIVALLVILDSEALSRPIADLTPLAYCAPTAARRIEASRTLLGKSPGPGAVEDARGRLKALLLACKQDGAYAVVARVDLDRVAQLLLNDPTTADLYRFKCDIAGVLARMVSAGGELVTVSQSVALLVIRTRTPYSERLLSHQIDAAIRALVSTPSRPDSLTDRTWKYPHDGLQLDDLLDATVG